MVARVLRRLHDTTRELFVLVMREGVRDTTVQRKRGRVKERERKGIHLADENRKSCRRIWKGSHERRGFRVHVGRVESTGLSNSLLTIGAKRGHIWYRKFENFLFFFRTFIDIHGSTPTRCYRYALARAYTLAYIRIRLHVDAYVKRIRILRSSAQRHVRGWESPLIYRRLESRLGISRRVNIRIEISSANSSEALWIFASLMQAASRILLAQSPEHHSLG